uniref:F-box domain-containing protein n=1 Tax=Strongyloides papillosus TaxID=174720 RepID=A0A0N5B7V9_STREA
MLDNKEYISDVEIGSDIINTLPPEIIFKIFNYLPAKYVVKQCSIVCKNWKTIIQKPQYWINRSLNEGCREVLPPAEIVNDPIYEWNFAKLFILRPFNRNLILNPSGEFGLEGWDSQRREERFQVERPGGSLESVFPTLETCFVSSYYECRKYCDIDLRDYGLSRSFLDRFKPTIYVSEMNSYRKDAAAFYSLRIQLHPGNINLDRSNHFRVKNNETTFTYKKLVDQWTDPVWETIEHNFSGYPSGCHQIFFDTIGRDNMFWAGNYGSKCCNATIIVKYEFNKPYEKVEESSDSQGDEVLDVEEPNDNQGDDVLEVE